MARLLVGALLLAAAAPATRAEAQAPDDIVRAVRIQAAVFGRDPDCMLRIIAREDSFYDPNLNNLAGLSDAHGLAQMTSDGVWLSTPIAQAGIDLYSTTAFEQLEAFAWALSRGYGSAWLQFDDCAA